MEGFVNTNVNSPFDVGLKHSKSYANYGVDKTYLNQNSNPPNNETKTQTNTSQKNERTYQNLSVNNVLGSILPEELPDNFDKAVTDTVDTVITPNQTGEQRAKTAIIIGTSALLVGGCVLALTHGKLSKKIVGQLGKFIENANEKINNIKQQPSTSKLEEYYLIFLQGTNKVASRIRGAFFNITPLKDVLFGKLVKEKLGLKKTCNAITNTFRGLSFKTVKSAYQKANQNFDSMTSLFLQTNARLASGEFVQSGGKQVDKELVKKLNKSVIKMNNAYYSSFDSVQLDKRNKSLIEKFTGLDKKVYDAVYGKIKTFVGDVDEWTTFVPERLVAKDKALIMNDLANKKRVITNNPADNHNAINDCISELDKLLNPKEKSSRNLIKNIKLLMEKYSDISGPEESSQREKLIKMINYHLHKAMETSQNEVYTPQERKQIVSLTRKIGKILNADKKGLLEELLTEYKELLPKEEYLKLKKATDNVSKSLNKAIHKEGFEYVDKSRDLAVGSALTDVATGMGLPLATTTIAMSAADTKQKKRSVVLKYGLPLLAGVATSTICTVMLISGGYALMFGSAVSLLSNEIFERIDNYLIKRNELKK